MEKSTCIRCSRATHPDPDFPDELFCTYFLIYPSVIQEFQCEGFTTDPIPPEFKEKCE